MKVREIYKRKVVARPLYFFLFTCYHILAGEEGPPHTEGRRMEELSRKAQVQKANLDDLKRKGASYDTLKVAAQAYLQTFYAWQVQKYGRIRTHISVSRLIH
jgi:hypothetical protein